VTNQILFVDDDRRALDGYRRLLRRVFEIETAASGIQGLATIQVLGPFAVVVSDMRMTGMNGAEFLARVRELAPETVRILLTGCKDLDLAIEAVNDGQIFRYLNKPCGKDELVSAVRLGLAKYQSNAEDGELIKEARLRRMEAARSGSCETIPLK
jgi:DNA-binding NtrC family response regulator